MKKIIYQIHLWLGLLVSIPVLAWAFSGFLYALPNTVEGGKVDVIAQERVKISPNEAIKLAHKFAGKPLPTTALTLLMRDGEPYYQAIGGMGMDSLLVNAETGEVVQTPPPNFATRFFRQAHFYYFAGSWQITLLIIFSVLACFSALTGIYLNCVYWFGGKGKKKEGKIELSSEQVH
ncbi:MAG: PepSY domain-containing protein [Aridibacter sp.]